VSVQLDAPGATVDGKTISDWSKDWWNWIIDGPKDPFNQSDDRTGFLSHIHNNGPVFFLAGNNPFSTAGNNTDRFIVVSHDKEILVPLQNNIDIEGPGITAGPTLSDAEYRAIVDQSLAANVPDPANVKLNLTIDGKSFDSDLLKTHLEPTDFFSMGPVKPGSLLTSPTLGIAPGTATDFNKATGYYAMLENFSKGIHTVSFGGTVTDATGAVIQSVQTTDHLIVV